MPPKQEKSTKDESPAQPSITLPERRSSVQQQHGFNLPELGESPTAPSPQSRRSSATNPAIRYEPIEIELMSPQEISDLDRLVEERKPLDEILAHYFGKRILSRTSSKRWLEKFKEFRHTKSSSNLPGDIATAGPSSEAIKQKQSEDAIAKFYHKLCSKCDWTIAQQRERRPSGSKVKSSIETSSDSEEEISEKHDETLRRYSEVPRRLSWKDYKKTTDFDKLLSQKTDNVSVKKLVKMTVKELFKKKKKASKVPDCDKVIEVEQLEVADMIYEVTDHVAKKYLPRIKDLAIKLDPARDYPGSECASVSYDSQDNFYERKEDERALLSKMTMAVSPHLLVHHGLCGILLVTLPLCSDNTDADQLYQFIDILKETKDSVTREALNKLRDEGNSETTKEREVKPVRRKIVAVHAEVEPTQSSDTMAGLEEIREVHLLASPEEDISSLSDDISDRLRTFKSVGSEGSQSIPYIDEDTSDRMDAVFREDAPSEPAIPEEGTSGGQSEKDNLQQSDTVLLEPGSRQAKRDCSPRPPETPSKKANISEK